MLPSSPPRKKRKRSYIKHTGIKRKLLFLNNNTNIKRIKLRVCVYHTEKYLCNIYECTGFDMKKETIFLPYII